MAVVKIETSSIVSTQWVCLDCWIYGSHDAPQDLHYSEIQSTILLKKCKEYMLMCGPLNADWPLLLFYPFKGVPDQHVSLQLSFIAASSM